LLLFYFFFLYASHLDLSSDTEDEPEAKESGCIGESQSSALSPPRTADFIHCVAVTDTAEEIRIPVPSSSTCMGRDLGAGGENEEGINQFRETPKVCSFVKKSP
jgi:hypothetical protein